jgi:hypothetical protein
MECRPVRDQPTCCVKCGGEIKCGERVKYDGGRYYVVVRDGVELEGQPFLRAGDRVIWIRPTVCARCGNRPWAMYGREYIHFCSPACEWRQRRARNRIKQRECSVCGKLFTTTRVDAKFCSNACRQKAHRRLSAKA